MPAVSAPHLFTSTAIPLPKRRSTRSKYGVELVYNQDAGPISTAADGSPMTAEDFIKLIPSIGGPKAKFVPEKHLRSGVLQTVVMARDGTATLCYTPEQLFYLQLEDRAITSVSVSTLGGSPNMTNYVAFHGMGGDDEKSYVVTVANACHRAGGRVWLVTLRGCGNLPMTSPTIHHGGMANDVGAVLAYVQQRCPLGRLAVLGNSLSSSMGSIYLKVTGDKCPVNAMLACSLVGDYAKSADAVANGRLLTQGLDYAIGFGYKAFMKKHKAAIVNVKRWADAIPPTLPRITPSFSTFSLPTSPPMSRTSTFSSCTSSSSSSFSDSFPSPTLSTPASSLLLSISEDSSAMACASFESFPDYLDEILQPHTGPILTPSSPLSHQPGLDTWSPELEAVLNKGVKKFLGCWLPRFTDLCTIVVGPSAGFDSNAEFHHHTTAAHILHEIKETILVTLNAEDDPLMPGKILPRAETLLSTNVIMAVTKYGGHLGWFGKGNRGKPAERQWSADVAYDFAKAVNSLAPRPRQELVELAPGVWAPKDFPGMSFKVVSPEEVEQLKY